MKNFKKIVLLVLLLLSCYSTFAQTISDEEKKRIIADLDSVHSIKCTEAIDQVVEYKIKEALPKIESNFWRTDIGDKPLFLYALREFNSSRAYEFAKGYLDSLKTYVGIDTTDIYIDKSYAIAILFENNDFSYSDYILSLLCCNEMQYRTALPLLSYIINNDPINSQRALDLLINTAQNATISTVRSSALFYYEILKGKEALPLLINSYLNDGDPNVRGRILRQYFLQKYVTPDVELALRSKIKQEDSPTNRVETALILFKNYSSPVNYKIVSELAYIESDSFAKWSLNNKINNYTARRPDDILTVIAMIDSLSGYIDEVYSYEWIKNETYKNYLTQRLQSAKNYLTSSDSLNCARQIKWYQLSVQQVYSDSAGSYPKYVSRDGYKFLYYYPQYILERLPEATEPRNDLIAKASAEITTANGILQYSYTITNETVSNQSAANIYVEDTTTSTASAPVNWLTEKVENKLDRFYTTTNQITAGSSQSGYLVTSNSLPVIGKVYVQSERFAVDTTDIKTNSYTVTTVVPSQRPAQINASAFIDSMISYNNRAYSLGWMQYYWVRDNNYYQLNNAKTMINMNVPASAVVILIAFEGWLDTCMSQSYFNKETYGLLKYNSIYLREKLSGQ